MVISHQDAIETAVALGLPEIAQQLIRGDEDIPDNLDIWFGAPPEEFFLMDEEEQQEYDIEGVIPLWSRDISNIVAYHYPSQKFVRLDLEVDWDLETLPKYSWQQILFDFFEQYWPLEEVSEEKFHEVAKAFGFKHASEIIEAHQTLDRKRWVQWKDRLLAELAGDE